MKTFTIEKETNNIMIHASSKDAEVVPNSERFGTEAALAKLAGYWPASRLVEIWNSLPGETPVRKFKDRATAVSRIWKALQSLGQTAPAADDAAPATFSCSSRPVPRDGSRCRTGSRRIPARRSRGIRDLPVHPARRAHDSGGP